MDKFPMTPKGHQALIDELKHLKTVVRPKVVQDIAEARSHGDLSENAEYDAAKEKQAFVETRIREVEGKLARAQVISTEELQGTKVVFGATVTVYDFDSDTEQVWTIVGEDEADLKARKLSVSSPFARAMIGRTIGDQFEFRSPKGVKECEIRDVQFQMID